MRPVCGGGPRLLTGGPLLSGYCGRTRRQSGGSLANTLLAVEDSKTMRKVLGITFASGDYEAVLVEDPAQALTQLDELKPDVVLLDVTLGNTTGYDLCRQVKDRAPGTPVMILSSRQQPYDPVRGAEVQADDFIDKPFETEKIRDKVSKLCEGRPSAPMAHSARPLADSPSFLSRPPSIPRTPPPAMPPPPAARTEGPERPTLAPAHASADSSSVADALRQKLNGLELTAAQTEAVLALSREVVEQVVWEVVPVMAETLIKEELARLTRE